MAASRPSLPRCNGSRNDSLSIGLLERRSLESGSSLMIYAITINLALLDLAQRGEHSPTTPSATFHRGRGVIGFRRLDKILQIPHPGLIIRRLPGFRSDEPRSR